MVSLAILCVLCIALHSTSATNQVVLTCGSDQGPGDRGPVGPPGKRGAIGFSGPKGAQGPKGEPGESDTWRRELEILQARVTALEEQEHIHPTSITSPTTQPTTVGIPTTQPATTQPLPNVTNCQELLNLGQRRSGIYQIHVNGLSHTIPVYCDQITGRGGWLVIQRRTDGSEDFFRNWADYRRGFGNQSNEFWLGLDVIHAIISEKTYELRIDMEDFEGENAYANYRTFRIGPLSDNYRLEIGGYSGNAGDSLDYQNKRQFSTKDHNTNGCVTERHGAWWYSGCAVSNLNGLYLAHETSRQSASWWYWKRSYYSLKRVDMKIRPV